MMITINGENFITDKEMITVIDLLNERNVSTPETVSVQVNGSFVKRKNFNTTVVKENDEVDFIFMMSGGSFPDDNKTFVLHPTSTISTNIQKNKKES